MSKSQSFIANNSKIYPSDLSHGILSFHILESSLSINWNHVPVFQGTAGFLKNQLIDYSTSG